MCIQCDVTILFESQLAISDLGKSVPATTTAGLADVIDEMKQREKQRCENLSLRLLYPAAKQCRQVTKLHALSVTINTDIGER